MEITRKHLSAFYSYEGKQDSLNRVGTKKEKLLFQNGEFGLITELIRLDSQFRNGDLTQKEEDIFKNKLKTLNVSKRNRRTITSLSKRFIDKDNTVKNPNSFMYLLEFITDILKGIS